MWAQLIQVRLKEGADDGLTRLTEQLRAAEQADSGLVRTSIFRDQADPCAISMLAVFESEEHARAREGDPRRADGLAAARATMAEIFAGPPSFTDLVVFDEYVP
jgi:quinol monooxygenase YgiN